MEALIKPETGLIFWTILIFFILVVVLAKTVWKPLLKAVEERENKIKNDIEMAAKAKEEAEKIRQEINEKLTGLKTEIEKRLSEARKEAIAEKEKIIENAKREAGLIIENAKTEVENAKNSVRKELQKEAVNIAIEISRKALTEMIDREIDSKLSSIFAKQLVAGGKKEKI